MSPDTLHRARILARRRLWAHLDQITRLAGGGNVPAARLVLDDVMSDLDDIAHLDDETARAEASDA
jgi:hypothetical protein